jgi:hypothetical protein
MQTAKSGTSCFTRFISSIQIAFALDFLLPNAVRLVPMQFGQSDASTGQADPSNAFQFSSPPFAIMLPKAFDDHGFSSRRRLSQCRLKVHLLIFVSCHRSETHHAAQRGASHKSESFATMTSGVDPKDERSAHVRGPHAFSGMRPSVTVDAIAPASAIRGFFHCA